MAIRDMSKKQFEEALERNGFKREGFMGYVNLGIEGQHVAVSHHNAGENRRAKLAYLLKKRAEFEKKIAEETKTKAS